jgi:hypothetical protein
MHTSKRMLCPRRNASMCTTPAAPHPAAGPAEAGARGGVWGVPAHGRARQRRGRARSHALHGGGRLGARMHESLGVSMSPLVSRARKPPLHGAPVMRMRAYSPRTNCACGHAWDVHARTMEGHAPGDAWAMHLGMGAPRHPRHPLLHPSPNTIFTPPQAWPITSAPDFAWPRPALP